MTLLGGIDVVSHILFVCLPQLETNKPASDTEALDSVRASMEEQLRVMQEKLKNSEAELEAAQVESKSQIESLKQDCEALRAEVESSMASQAHVDTVALSKSEEQLERKDQEAKEIQTKLETELAEKQSELNAKVSLIQSKEKMIKLLKNQAEVLESKMKKGGDTDALKQELEMTRTSSQQTEAKLTAELKSMRAELAEKNRRLQSAEEEVTQRRARIAKVRTTRSGGSYSVPSLAVLSLTLKFDSH